MSKTKNLYEETMLRKQMIHDEIVKKELKSLNEKIKSEKYNIDTIISRSSLGDTYHDLINSKDKLNSQLQSNYNQTYHSIDVELYKLNKKIENESRMVDYKIRTKLENLSYKIKSEIL